MKGPFEGAIERRHSGITQEASLALCLQRSQAQISNRSWGRQRKGSLCRAQGWVDLQDSSWPYAWGQGPHPVSGSLYHPQSRKSDRLCLAGVARRTAQGKTCKVPTWWLVHRLNTAIPFRFKVAMGILLFHNLGPRIWGKDSSQNPIK